MLFANGVCGRDLPRDSSMPSDLVMICQWASLFYAIDGFPGDDLLWRIEWLGGVGYNTSVPSEPQIDVSLAQLPKGEGNPLSARARSSQVEKRTVGPVLPGSNLSEAAIGVASTHSGFRAEPSAADYSGA